MKCYYDIGKKCRQAPAGDAGCLFRAGKAVKIEWNVFIIIMTNRFMRSAKGDMDGK